MFFWKKNLWKRYLAFLLIIYPKKFVAGKESEIAKEKRWGASKCLSKMLSTPSDWFTILFNERTNPCRIKPKFSARSQNWCGNLWKQVGSVRICDQKRYIYNTYYIEHILSLILSQKPRHLTLTLETLWTIKTWCLSSCGILSRFHF